MKDKELFHPDELLIDIIPSYSFSQEIILQSIMRLYNINRFEIDPCYSKGNFYKKNIPEPIYKYDINPQTKNTVKCDCTELSKYHKDYTVKSIIFDPPFLIWTSKKEIEEKGNSKIKNRFSAFKSIDELYGFYRECICKFYYLLQKNGILIFKCQDFISSRLQNWSHIKIYNLAIKYRFYGLDLFILLSKQRLLNNALKSQEHARKYHSYFWVFKKK